MEIILAGLLAPAILFFVLGIISVLVKSDLEIPPAMSKGLAIFLLVWIGLDGGRDAVRAIQGHPAVLGVIVVLALVAIIIAAVTAYSTANIFKKVVGIKEIDAWATGGLYGSVSSATLIVAAGLALAAHAARVPGTHIYGGWMPAMDPFLEGPAIIVAIVFGRMALAKEGIMAKGIKMDLKKIIHETIFGMSVWLLVGGLIVGIIAQIYSPGELTRTMVFFSGDMARGVLALFLIDMGMAAGKRLGVLKELGSKLIIAVITAFILPLFWGIVGILGVRLVSLAFPGAAVGWGDALVFAAMTGGASFISAPAAMRAALPEANPSVYLPLSVALTFPFNIILGIPLWMMVARFIWGM